MQTGRSNQQKETYLLQHSKERIVLSQDPFAGGGEGNLYHIVSPVAYQKKYVAKIYHPHKLTEERASKIEYLTTYQPAAAQAAQGGHVPVVWCTDVLLKDGVFAGFIMPYTKGEKLEILCTPKIPRKLRARWKRFSFREGAEASAYRLRLGFNLCAAIHQVHKMERYVLVDMKPDNIMIQPNGLVSIVDTDSVEVVEGQETLFDAPVATPEYTPPEHYQKLNYDATQQQSWDLFGLGVILYKLFFGIHPFAASTKAPYEHLTTLAQKIETGFFVHDPKHANSFSIIPPPHRAFNDLNEELQQLFMRCFVDGQDYPEMRPTAEEWCAALLLATDDQAAHERYGHILQRKRGRRKMYMALPSNKVKLPVLHKSFGALQVLDEEKSNIPAAPNLSPSQYVEFRKPEKIKSVHTLIAAGVAIGFVTIGMPIISLLIVAIFLGNVQEEFKKTSAYKQLQRAEKELGKAKKKHQYIKGQTTKKRKRLRRRLGKTARHIEHILGLIQQEVQKLQDYLSVQDEKVKGLNEKANQDYEYINDSFVQEAKANRAVARVGIDQYRSLEQIRAALDIEQKRAVQELSLRHAIQTNNETYEQEKIAIEQLFDKRLSTLEQRKKEERARLKATKDRAMNELYKQLDQEANLIKNWPRLWNGVKRNANLNNRLQEDFRAARLYSMLQIARIDVNDQYIELNGGQKVMLHGIGSSKQILRNMLYWMDEIKHERKKIAEEEQKLNSSIQTRLNAIQDNERLEIGKLEQSKQRQLQQVKVLVPAEQLGEPYQQLQQHYQTASSYVEELEAAHAVEEQSLTQQYQAQYEQIIANSEAKAAVARKHIVALQQQLEQHKKRLQDRKVQRDLAELERYQRELDIATRSVEDYLNRVERHKKITFKNYLQLLIKKK
jgi:serine/threonine protein kinase